MREAVIKNNLVPLYAGSSLRNKGVQPLLDGVINFLPSPLDLPPIKGTNPKTGAEEERAAEKKAPFSALLFKIQTDPHVGRLSYLRIYSGILKAGSTVLNASRGKVKELAACF